MLVTLIEKDRIYNMALPQKVSGQFWITHKVTDDSEERVASIEAINGEWVLRSSKTATLLDTSNKNIRSVDLKPLSIYYLNLSQKKEKVFLFTEPITENRQVFDKYRVLDNTSISIGRGEQNEIVFSNKFVSSTHAIIRFEDGRWSIEDKGSMNGTFVNEVHITKKELKVGDLVYILGFKIIIGFNFLALNNPDNKVSINRNTLLTWESQNAIVENEEEPETINQRFFYRSPRLKRDIESAVFTIDPPPQPSSNDDIPIYLLLGPSITMGMASMATGIFAISNAYQSGNFAQSMPTVVMSLSMLLGTLLWPLLSKRFERKRKLDREIKRQEKYREYLSKMNKTIIDECQQQCEILKENHIDSSDCIDRVLKIDRNLWERSINQEDFLRVRIGTGDVLSKIQIKYPARRFQLETDVLHEELLSLCEEEKYLENVPITVSLKQDHILGVIGNKGDINRFSSGLICQLASLHSYDELKLIFIFDSNEQDTFDYVKWLPHVWNNEKTVRFVGSNSSDIKEISALIEREIEYRGSLNESELAKINTHYVIFSFSKTLGGRCEMIKQVLARREKLGISLVNLYGELNHLPKECLSIIEINENEGKMYEKNDVKGRFVNFKLDSSVFEKTDEYAKRIANIKLDVLEDTFHLPSMITFLEMFGVGKIEHLNSLVRWKENDPTRTLEAEVGMDSLGERFKLDLHEKFHGPHGLVAGMTGSGKSEFIMTYILSMSVNYHPNEVSFILIDYKGGGMAKSFENLPHTVGVITNLDGPSVKRSLVSIQSELRRRQAKFNDAGKIAGASNIDIYRYQKLYRDGKVDDPLGLRRVLGTRRINAI